MPRPHLLPGILAAMLAANPAQAFAQSEQFVRPSPRVEIATHVSEASQQFGIPEHWIYAVIRAESAGRVRAVSRAGAMGLMQLMPGTWSRQRARFSLGQDPFDPRGVEFRHFALACEVRCAVAIEALRFRIAGHRPPPVPPGLQSRS